MQPPPHNAVLIVRNPTRQPQHIIRSTLAEAITWGFFNCWSGGALGRVGPDTRSFGRNSSRPPVVIIPYREIIRFLTGAVVGLAGTRTHLLKTGFRGSGVLFPATCTFVFGYQIQIFQAFFFNSNRYIMHACFEYILYWNRGCIVCIIVTTDLSYHDGNTYSHAPPMQNGRPLPLK